MVRQRDGERGHGVGRFGVRGFGSHGAGLEARAQRDGAGEQDAEDADGDEGDAEGAAEVGLESWRKEVALDVLLGCWVECLCLLDASRTSGESSVTIIWGEMIIGAAWRASHAAVPYV